MCSCFRCGSFEIVDVYAKSNDCNSITYNHDEYEGYINKTFSEIGCEDRIEFSYCKSCGQIQDSIFSG